MPRGPRGEKRPADVIGNAVKVMRIATGEEEKDGDDSKAYHRAGGVKGGAAGDVTLDDPNRNRYASRPWLPAGFEFLSGLPEPKRRRRRLMPVQAFVDDSGGRGHSQYFVLAGLIGDAESWASFSDEWDACLKATPAISRFKMRDAARCTGEFRSFSASARDDKLRQLCRIINQRPRLLTYTVIDLSAHAETWAKNIWAASRDPYFWAYHNTILNAALSLWDFGWRERFEIIFDENLIFGTRAKRWYPAVLEIDRALEPDAASLMPIEPLFRSDDEFLPIQAADLFAWLLRHGFDKPDERPMPWLLDELTNITETEYSQVYDKERMESVMAESARLFSHPFSRINRSQASR